MTTKTLAHNDHHEHDSSSIAIFGFWVFLLSDFILFATLFIAYVVLHNNTFGGVGVKEVASLPYVLVESLILLTACLTYGLGTVAMHKEAQGQVMFWLLLTFIIGLVFLGMQMHMLGHLMQAGYSWKRSAFLSIFFTLLGVHGFHLIAGLLWTLILMAQLTKQGLSSIMKTRLTCLGMYWVFLNLIWVFIFTIVFLMGAL